MCTTVLLVYDIVLFYFCRNYDAEISAFQARIGEQFDAQKLRQAFVTKEYLESEIQSKKSLGFTDDNNEDESSTSSDSDSDEVKQLSQCESIFLILQISIFSRKKLQHNKHSFIGLFFIVDLK